MRRILWCATAVLMWSCSSAPDVVLPGSMENLSEAAVSACPVNDVLPGATGSCYAASHVRNGWWMVLRDPKIPGDISLAYSGPEGTWQFALPLEPAGLDVTDVTVHSLRVGDLVGDPTPEVALVVGIKSRDPGRALKQERTAAYLVSVGHVKRLLWYATLSLKGSYSVKCRSEEVRYTGDVVWQMMGPMVTGVTLAQRRTAELCVGGEGCDAPRTCTKESAGQELGWIYNDEMDEFRLFGREQGVLRVPDVGLEKL